MQTPTWLLQYGMITDQLRVISTNARPDVTFPIERKCGYATVHIDQPENVFLYNKYMNGVDKHDQLQMKYNIGQFSVKA